MTTPRSCAPLAVARLAPLVALLITAAAPAARAAPGPAPRVPGTTRPLPAGFEALGSPCPAGTPRAVQGVRGFGQQLVCGPGGRVAAVFQSPYRLQLAHFPSFVHQQTPPAGAGAALLRRGSGLWVGVVGRTVWVRKISCGACRRIMGWTAVFDPSALDDAARVALQRLVGLPLAPPLRSAAAWRQAYRPRPTTGAPTRFEIFAALLANAQLPLSLGRHCQGVVGAPLKRPPTLGDWVAYNLSVLEGGKVRLPASCTPAGTTTRGRIWDCQVGFSVTNPKTQLFWTWGVRFQLRDHQRRLVPRSLVCTGSG